MSLATLLELQGLLNKAIADLQTITSEKSTTIPDLNEPFHPDSEIFRATPAAEEAAAVASAAAMQIVAILRSPQVSLYQIVAGPFLAAALRICLESSVTEILREAGPRGLHVKEIAAQNGLDPNKLTRFLRALATHHIYREVEPDVFANNRLSSLLDTLKPSKEVLSNPERKHDGTVGFTALVGHHLDETFKASAWAWEAASNPSASHSEHESAAPWTRAFNTQDNFWRVLQRPGEKIRHNRFNMAMKGVASLQPFATVVEAFDWKALEPGSVVVDVGGGIGSAMMALSKEFPHLKLVVQDLPHAIEQAKETWKNSAPEVIESGRAVLEVQDFFTPQRQTNASVFFLKQILHDWSDERCRAILTHLRQAATPQTKLIIMDAIIQLACRDISEEMAAVPGAIPREAPAPLLANYGAVTGMAYYADLVMYMLFNSLDRTIRHVDRLLRSTGWKFVAVNRLPGDGTFAQPIVAIPTELPPTSISTRL